MITYSKVSTNRAFAYSVVEEVLHGVPKYDIMI